MYEDLIKRLKDSEHEIDCSLCDRDCCYPDGKVHGKCIIIEAADAIEAQDRHILTLQHEMMAEAESHIAEVNRLNKQIEELQADVRPVVLCRDCMLRKFCKEAQYRGEDGFCSYGEKREES